MKKLSIAFVVFVFLLSSCGGSEKENDGTVKLIFNPGKSENISIRYELAVTNHSNGENSIYQMNASLTSDSIADGNAEIQIKNEGVSMTGVIFNKSVSADAKDVEKLNDTIKTATMTMFSVYNKKYKSVFNSRLDKISDIQINDSGFVDSTESRMNFYLKFPANAVKVGDTWEKELNIKSNNRMNCSAKFTLKELKGDSAIISVSGKLTGKGQSLGHDISMDGNLNGNFTVDTKSGWPVFGEITQDFKLMMDGNESQIVNKTTYSITKK